MLTYFRGLRFFESAWLNFCWDGCFESVEIISGRVENFRGGGGGGGESDWHYFRESVIFFDWL